MWPKWRSSYSLAHCRWTICAKHWVLRGGTRVWLALSKNCCNKFDLYHTSERDVCAGIRATLVNTNDEAAYHLVAEVMGKVCNVYDVWLENRMRNHAEKIVQFRGSVRLFCTVPSYYCREGHRRTIVDHKCFTKRHMDGAVLLVEDVSRKRVNDDVICSQLQFFECYKQLRQLMEIRQE